MNTPLHIRATAFAAALAVTFVLVQSVALLGLPPGAGDALVAQAAPAPVHVR
ncbi:hypothetical protein [Ideonella sp.]|uniref:hypothetical protein n=1 Tax=Ideonella sp. TaxID=1929293 RepID=UPI002B488964|nr:hypothetical protein [Ideonella sp.]HJV71395.1 hypothetical protein [Ideonella sp.]